jgi:hypothetical protein
MQDSWELHDLSSWASLSPRPLEKADFQQLCASTPPLYLPDLRASTGMASLTAANAANAAAGAVPCTDWGGQVSSRGTANSVGALGLCGAQTAQLDHARAWESVQSLLAECVSTLHAWQS